MITFREGPANGVHLTLQRAPPFIRVVEDNGHFDALDQLNDTPKPGETIHVYKRNGSALRCMVDGRKYRGPLAVAEYTYLQEQPDPDAVRRTQAWRAWCQLQLSQHPTRQRVERNIIKMK